MQLFPTAVDKLTDQFKKLPGIGTKTAQRLAFHVISMTNEQADEFATAITDVKKSVHLCPVCQNLTDSECCKICSDESRDSSVLCVVAEPKDVAAIEATHEFRGKYHVLHGVISPMQGIGPDSIKLRELVLRLSKEDIKEVIIATDPDVEGEATALYIAKLLKPFNVKVTGLAYGIPMGGHLEFADKVTLMRALEGRREI